MPKLILFSLSQFLLVICNAQDLRFTILSKCIDTLAMAEDVHDPLLVGYLVQVENLSKTQQKIFEGKYFDSLVSGQIVYVDKKRNKLLNNFCKPYYSSIGQHIQNSFSIFPDSTALFLVVIRFSDVMKFYKRKFLNEISRNKFLESILRQGRLFYSPGSRTHFRKKELNALTEIKLDSDTRFHYENCIHMYQEAEKK